MSKTWSKWSRTTHILLLAGFVVVVVYLLMFQPKIYQGNFSIAINIDLYHFNVGF